jgi:inosose dehydratase
MNHRTRRDVFQKMGLMAAGSALSSLDLPNTLAQGPRTAPGIKFGVQLNAFPIDPRRFQTFMDTLAEAKQVGYQGFESSFRNVSEQFAAPEQARRSIAATGLTFFGIHAFLPTEQYDPMTGIAPPSVYEPVAQGGAALGAKHLILSGAPVDNQDQLDRKIAALNAVGEFAKRAGLAAAYHNHWLEFESRIGEIEALYTRTDLSLVSFVLDAGHAYRGGANVPEFIRVHAQRIVGFHLRDYKDGRLVSLGQGTFPLAQVAASIKQIGWKGWVENEEEREDLSKTGLEVIAPAYRAMKEAFTK